MRRQRNEEREPRITHQGTHSAPEAIWNEDTAAIAAVLTGGGREYLQRNPVSLPEAGKS